MPDHTDAEELVQGAIHRGSRQCVLDLEDCLTEQQHRREAREVLAALAEAGLLPAGGQTREESRHRRPMPETPCTGPDLWCTAPEHHEVRTVHIGPWRDVTP